MVPTDIYEIITIRHMNGDFGQWLDNQLTTRGLTKADIERESGGDISGPQVSRIISGARGYEASSIRAIAKALKMPQAEVFYAAGLLTEPPGEPALANPILKDIWCILEGMTDEQLAGMRLLAEMVISTRGSDGKRRGTGKDR